MGRIVERSPDLVRGDEDGSGRAVQPEMAGGRFHQPTDAAKNVSTFGPQRPEAVGLEDREAALAGHPQMPPSLVNGERVADIESIAGHARSYRPILANRA